MGKALTEAINRAKLVGFEIIKVNRDILTPYSDKQGYIARMDRGADYVIDDTWVMIMESTDKVILLKENSHGKVIKTEQFDLFLFDKHYIYAHNFNSTYKKCDCCLYTLGLKQIVKNYIGFDGLDGRYESQCRRKGNIIVDDKSKFRVIGILDNQVKGYVPGNEHKYGVVVPSGKVIVPFEYTCVSNINTERGQKLDVDNMVFTDGAVGHECANDDTIERALKRLLGDKYGKCKFNKAGYYKKGSQSEKDWTREVYNIKTLSKVEETASGYKRSLLLFGEKELKGSSTDTIDATAFGPYIIESNGRIIKLEEPE